MKVQLMGQARRVFDGDEVPGPDWDELMMETWATLDQIRRGAVEPDVRGRRDGVVYQYVRRPVDDRWEVALSPGGTGYVLIGKMMHASHVIYHRIDPWTQI